MALLFKSLRMIYIITRARQVTRMMSQTTSRHSVKDLCVFITVNLQEAYIADLDAKSGASLKLTLLNPRGRIWTMVAGGGASVVYRSVLCVYV